MTDLPFDDELVADVADERGVTPDRLRELAAAVQRAVQTDEGEYEYSSRHSYGWQDDRAYYLYGSAEAWSAFAEAIDADDAERDAIRELHRRAMVRSAAERDRREQVEEMLADGNEPLVVVNPGTEDAPFGGEV